MGSELGAVGVGLPHGLKERKVINKKTQKLIGVD